MLGGLFDIGLCLWGGQPSFVTMGPGGRLREFGIEGKEKRLRAWLPTHPPETRIAGTKKGKFPKGPFLKTFPTIGSAPAAG